MWLTLFASILVSLRVDNFVKAESSLTHCQATRVPVDLLREEVNVVYTMNRGCQICYEEANTLPSLKREMAMRGIEINVLVGISRAPRRIGTPGRSTILPSVKTDYRRVWTALGEENGHVFILDKCGRLIYQVIAPWALFMYPYVKAAILATHNDNPCGPCTAAHKTVKSDPKPQEAEYPAMLPTQPIDDLIISRDGTVPLRVVFTKRHTHAGSSTEYRVVELQTGNPTYHGHPDVENASSSPSSWESSSTTLGSTTTTMRTEEEQSRRAITARPSSITRQVQQRLESDDYSESDSETEETAVAGVEGEDDDEERNEEEKEKLKNHYGSLLNWLQYV